MQGVLGVGLAVGLLQLGDFVHPQGEFGLTDFADVEVAQQREDHALELDDVPVDDVRTLSPCPLDVKQPFLGVFGEGHVLGQLPLTAHRGDGVVVGGGLLLDECFQLQPHGVLDVEGFGEGHVVNPPLFFVALPRLGALGGGPDLVAVLANAKHTGVCGLLSCPFHVLLLTGATTRTRVVGPR